MVKTITDFTSIVQFRHPCELGGLCWSINFVLNLLSLPVAICLFANYSNRGTTPESQALFDSKVSRLTEVCISLLPLAVVLLGVLIKFMIKSYRQTLWSTMRAKDLTQTQFLESTAEAVKANAVRAHRRLWYDIRPQVKEVRMDKSEDVRR